MSIIADGFRRHGGRVSLYVLCALLAACGHKNEKDEPPDPMQKISTVSVDPLVVMPASVHYVSASQAWGAALGGVVGGAIVGAFMPNDPIRSKLDEKHVDMGAILVEEMRAALARQSRLRLVDRDADAVVSFEIKDYGFNTDSVLSGRMKVLLNIETKVRDRKGEVLFSDTDRETNQDDTRHSMSDYFDNLPLLNSAFHQVAAQAAADQSNSMLNSAGEAGPGPAAPPVVPARAITVPAAQPPPAPSKG